jgi:hypothetical protein
MMAVITLNSYAEALLQAFDESSLKTDAGVQAVLTYLLAYPGQTIGDLAGATGFDDADVRGYLSALGDLVESDGATWRPSARGRAEMEHALATAVGSVTSARPSGAAGLTAAEAARWEEVKRIVMDTVPGLMETETLRAQYEHYFSFVDSNPPKTLDEATAGYSHPKPGETDAEITFGNQGNMGLTVHRPGTQPAVEFGTLIQRFQESDDDCLLDADGPLIYKALALGLTFW